MWELIGHIIGFVAVLFAFFIFIQKERKKLLAFKLITDFLWITHFFMIGAYTPMLVTSVSVLRELIFINRDKYAILKNKITPVIFSFVFFIMAFLSWNGIKSLLSASGSALATFAFYESRVNRIRIMYLFVSCVMLVNGIVYGSFANILNEIITIGSITIGFLKGKD